MRITEIPTPAVLVDSSRLAANLSRMQLAASARGMRLRPHAKTHKSPHVARMQIGRGAVGICCAKLGEAEVFADEGITDIRLPYPLHPVNADRVFATVANFGHSHVFRSDDAGARWEDADNRQLPDVPHHAIAMRADQPDTLYVCNDVGVFVSPDAGLTWMNLSGNLPHVMMVDLVHHEADGTLSAASYGRSLWRLRVR